MDLPASLAGSKNQAAMATRVLRIVLNNLSPQDNTTHLLHGNHSIWTRHLSDCVGEEKQLLPSGGVDLGRDFAHKARVLDILSIISAGET